jgi:putative Mn2+ efflux pump MntP
MLHRLLISLPLFVSLGLDTFAVSIGLGISGLGRRERLRFAAGFALAEGLMPLVGFLLGQALASAIGEAASYLAIAFLAGVGIYTIRDARNEDERRHRPAALPVLLVAALSVSLDELAVGFGLGLLGIPILLAVLLIAAQACVMTGAGMELGKRLGRSIAEYAEVVSGTVLVLLAVALLGEKLLGA